MWEVSAGLSLTYHMSVIRKEHHILQCANHSYQEMKSILDDGSTKRCCLKGTGAAFLTTLKLREFDTDA